MRARTRTEIEARVATTRGTLERARQELTEARRAYLDAEAAYIDGGKRAQLEKKRDAGDEVERHEALVRRAEQAHDTAATDLAAVDRDEKIAKLDALKKELATHDATVAAHAAEFVALDRAVDVRVMVLAADIRSALVTYDEAAALASDLRLPFDQSVLIRPDLAAASTAVRRFVTAARQRERRDPLSPFWLSDSPDALDWRLRSMTHEELVGHEQGVTLAERSRAILHDQSLIEAGISAATQAKEDTTP